MKVFYRTSPLVWVYLSLASFANAEGTADLINDQIASHFEQVFSNDSDVGAPQKPSWVPGNDKEKKILGSAWTLEASATDVFDTGFEGVEGRDINVEFIETGLQVTFPLKPRHKLSLALNSTWYRLKETSDNGLPAILEIDEAAKIDAGFLYRLGLNPRWELLTGGGATITDSNNHGLGGKVTFLGYAGASYTFNPNLSMAFAFSLASREFQDREPFPLFMLDWRIDDRNRLLISNSLKYTYALTRDWRHVVGFEATSMSITLHMDSQFIGDRFHYDPAFVVRNFGLNLTYSYRFSNGMIFDGKFGLANFGEHGFWDDDEDFSTVEFEPAPSMTIGLRYRF